MVEELNHEDRVKEIARMLGGTSPNGKQLSVVSVKHAQELLERAR